MIYVEALQQAARRWGEDAFIRNEATESNRFRVGIRAGDVFWAKGVGQTWEEAFEAADRRREADCFSAHVQAISAALLRAVGAMPRIGCLTVAVTDAIEAVEDAPMMRRVTNSRQPLAAPGRSLTSARSSTILPWKGNAVFAA